MIEEQRDRGPRDGDRTRPSAAALERHDGDTQKLLPAGKPVPQIAPPRPRLRKWLWWLGGAALILLLIAVLHPFGVTPSAQTSHNQGPQAAAITAEQTRTGDMNIYIEALGTVTPLNTVTVYSQITGRVMAVHYREGQMVHEGDPLIDVDPRPYEATLEQAQGTLDRDRGVLAEARIDLERYQAAYAKNAIARQQLEDQQQVVVQDEGAVKTDEGTVSYDQTQLSYCHIVAPITGRVGLRLVDPGNTIFSGSSSTLVVITQLQPITVVFSVAEDDLAQVNAQLRGGNALAVDAFDRADVNRVASGTLTSLDNEVDTTTGTVKFRAQFPNQNLSLFPNQFVNARLKVRTLRKATLVPVAAVQYNGTAAFLYIVKPDNTVAVQNITVVNSDDKSAAVTGINPGVTIATSGFDHLENGAHVTVSGQAAGQKAAQSQNGAAPAGPVSK